MPATLTIPDLDEKVERNLRLRAASHGHSVEEEAREILTAAFETPTTPPPNPNKGKFDHLVGISKGRLTTDEVMQITRGE